MRGVLSLPAQINVQWIPATGAFTVNHTSWTGFLLPTGKTLGGTGVFNFSLGTLTLANAQVGWTKVSKTGSSLADLATRSASDLSSGTLPDSLFPAVLPALSGVNLTLLNASNLGSGTLPDARFPAILPALSGANLTNLNATNLASGTLPVGRLPAFTGDVTSSAGGAVTVLPVVNANVGTFGDGSHIPSLTVNAKGQVTAATSIAVNLPVDVRQYGAVGNGTTNDQASIAAAITAAGTNSTVSFSLGDYAIGSTITPLAGQTLLFAPGAILRARAGLTTGALITVSANDVTVTGATFAGRSDSAGLVAVTVNAALRVTLLRCTGATNLARLVIFTSLSNYGQVINCISPGVGPGAFASNHIEVNDSNYCRIQGNILYGAGAGNGVEIYQAAGRQIYGTQVIGNTFTGVVNSGVATFGSTGAIIADNVFRQTGSYGVFMTIGEVNAALESFGNIVKSNYFEDCGTTTGGTNAVYNNGIQNQIVGNTVLATGGVTLQSGIGIQQNRGDDNLIEGNFVKGVIGNGIYINAGDRVRVLNNALIDIGASGGTTAIGIQTVTTNGSKLARNNCIDTRAGGLRGMLQGAALGATTQNTVLVDNQYSGYTSTASTDSGSNNQLDGYGKFTSIVSPLVTGSTTTFTGNTTSSSTSTGTVVIQGGMGMSGPLFSGAITATGLTLTGSAFYLNGATSTNAPVNTQLVQAGGYTSGGDAIYGRHHIGADTNNNFGTFIGTRRDGGGAMHFVAGTRTSGTDTTGLDIDNAGVVRIASSAVTSSTSTGALVVSGGIGAGGIITAASIQSTPIGSTTASSGVFTTLTANTLTTANGLVTTSGGGALSSTLTPTGLTSVGAGILYINGASSSSVPTATKIVMAGTYTSGSVDAIYNRINMAADANNDYAAYTATRRDAGNALHFTAGVRTAGTDTKGLDLDSSGNAVVTGTLTASSLVTTQTPSVGIAVASTNRVPILLNGVTYYILLTTVGP